MLLVLGKLGEPYFLVAISSAVLFKLQKPLFVIIRKHASILAVSIYLKGRNVPPLK